MVLSPFLLVFNFFTLSSQVSNITETVTTTAATRYNDELVFLPGQLERVLNLDEIEVTTDGTSKWTGGWPTTKMSSTNEKSTQGATEAHKSSYSTTLIGGSNMASWPIPHTLNWLANQRMRTRGLIRHS